MHPAPADDLAAAPTETFSFTLNGETVTVHGASPTTTLLDWLRRHGRTGTKCGCSEGDCGACSVALLDRDGTGRATYRTINSCLALLPMVAGREIITVEGLAGVPSAALHPVQAAMTVCHGSQCGYCTPGFVMSLFEGYYRGALSDPVRINDQLAGNLCRCTGYRPIRDAALLAATEADTHANDIFASRLCEAPPPLAPVAYEHRGERFHRPTSLGALFALRRQYPEARLVAGATEIGVELNKKFRAFPQLISTEAVPELTALEATPEAWVIGAAVPLTVIEERVAPEYPSLAKMLAVFASRQIRNRATLGGNLVTASPIGDSAPVLLTLDASVVLAGPDARRTVPLAGFFTGYRKTVLQRDEILLAVHLPRHPSVGMIRHVGFEKVSHRRDLDISIVAAAFRVDVAPDGTIAAARIAYGGVAPTVCRAVAAERALLGKTLAAAADNVAAELARAYQPIDDVRATAAYRRGLVTSLWRKFAASPGESGPPSSFQPGATWTKLEPSRALRHESSRGHVTGACHYVDDLAQRRPMLEVWPVLSPHARARILRRDATRARTLPGVAAVLFAADIPGENNVGPVRHDEPLLATDAVHYHGQLVALVVGDSVAACRAAAAAVVVEYEPETPVVTLREAIERQQYLTEPRVMQRGDVAAALPRAPHRLAGEFELGGQEHFYLETQAAWAEGGDEGDVLVCSSTQHPSEIQAIVSEVLHLPRHRVVVQAPRLGGGFGGKETQGNAPAALVALAAIKTRQPVRLQWDRDVDMITTGKRHPFLARFEVGFTAEGRITALTIDLVSNGGWSLDLSQPVLDRAMFHLDNAYYLPAVRFTGRVARTNTASNTAFRGFGGPQGMLVIEEVMARVAASTGLPPEVVRERNLYHGTGETNRTHYGADVGDHRLQRMWTQCREEAHFDARQREIAAFNAAHATVKRGLAITPVKFGISFTLTHYNQAGALVHIYQDGTVQVNHGGTEMGQGLHTKILGVAMRELGLPAAMIRMMRTSTDKVPNTSASAASASADLNGAAVQAACATLRERMRPVAARLLARAAAAAPAAKVGVDIADTPGEKPSLPATATGPDLEFVDGHARLRDRPEIRVPWEKIAVQCYIERISLSATGYYATPGISWDWSTGTGRPFAYYACGVAASEVEVDGHTGMLRVRRVDIVHDVGDSLNSAVDRGQVEGGFVQGLGWLTSEELKWNARGELLTHSASTYQIPACSDAPMEFNVTLLPQAHNPAAVHGSKAVGEPPLMLAISVREAIRAAVAAFAPQPGVPVMLPSPATPEAIFTALHATPPDAPHAW